MKKIFVLAGLTLVFLAGCADSGAKKAPETAAVNIDDLLKEYRASKEALRSKSQGKEVVVIGKAGKAFDPVTALESEDKKHFYYDVRASSPGGLNCMVEKDKTEKFQTVKEDEIIAVKGTLYVNDGSLEIKPCTREMRDTK